MKKPNALIVGFGLGVLVASVVLSFIHHMVEESRSTHRMSNDRAFAQALATTEAAAEAGDHETVRKMLQRLNERWQQSIDGGPGAEQWADEIVQMAPVNRPATTQGSE